ncbi:hypothetical protein GS462_04045 [Rhodococcus hoagii]|nr:hypothetical protein [Prescottella equi]MBM4649582.1 hypothetical protein [Prescottella equi]
MPEPRAQRGGRHRLAVIMSVALAAVYPGARSFTAVAEWVDDPSTSCSPRRRCIGVRVVGVWAWIRTMIGGRRVIAVDGKTLRGARDAAGHLPRPLAAINHGSGGTAPTLVDT